MTAPSPTVFVVDDDPSVLKAVSRLLRSAGFRVSEFESAQRFLNQYAPSACGCLLLDMAMPGLSGLELQQALVARGGPIPIVFLTGQADVPASVLAMKGGALDLLTKPVDDQVLIATVRRAIETEIANREDRIARIDARRSLETLTQRERQVFDQVVAGRLNKQIAASLGTAEKTIKVHRARVMAKMKAASLADLVRIAQRIGPVTD